MMTVLLATLEGLLAAFVPLHAESLVSGHNGKGPDGCPACEALKRAVALSVMLNETDTSGPGCRAMPPGTYQPCVLREGHGGPHIALVTEGDSEVTH